MRHGQIFCHWEMLSGENNFHLNLDNKNLSVHAHHQSVVSFLYDFMHRNSVKTLISWREIMLQTFRNSEKKHVMAAPESYPILHSSWRWSMRRSSCMAATVISKTTRCSSTWGIPASTWSLRGPTKSCDCSLLDTSSLNGSEHLLLM